MISLTAIQTFVAVVERGNFSKAAVSLHISPMAVSKQINQLEQTLRVDLFERSTRKMELTEVGKILYEQFKEIVNSLENVSQFVAASQKTPSGTLSVVSTFSIGENLLITYLPEFLALYPKIHLQLKLSDLAPDFSKEKVDIAIGFRLTSISTQQVDLRHVKFHSFYRKVYASKSYLKKHGHPKTLEECRGLHYIDHYYRPEDEFLNICRKNNIELKIVVSSNSINAVTKCCIAGLGLASISDYTVKNLGGHEELIALDGIIDYTPFDTYIFYRNLHFIEPKILCFKEFFKEKFI